MGTAGYMSPEQATGGEVDARSDVFSFGAVLYEMVTGRRAFAGNSTAETLAAVVRDAPKAPSEVPRTCPKELERLILRCLRKEPERRFQHMADVKVELRRSRRSRSPVGRAAVAARPVAVAWVARGGRSSGCLRRPAAAWLWWRSPDCPAAPGRGAHRDAGSGRQPTFSPDGKRDRVHVGREKGDNWDIYLKMIGPRRRAD